MHSKIYFINQKHYPRIAFLSNQIGTARNSLRAVSLDVGMVQLDSIRVDVDATLNGVEQLYRRRDALVRQESDFLAQNTIGAVVADIPALPIEAATLLEIPSIAIGNFGWDWIYSEFLERDPRWSRIVDMFRKKYSHY